MKYRLQTDWEMECANDQFYRKTYTRKLKSGRSIRVPGACIRSQSRYAAPYKPTRVRMRGIRLSRRSLKTCPAGYINRASYVRYTKQGKHVVVPEQCIKDVGAPGKGYVGGPGKGIGPLRKGELSKYGYDNVKSMSEAARHAALASAISEYGTLGLWRKLNAVAVYTRRSSPTSSAIIKKDMDWIRSTYGLKAFD